MLARAL
jgi:hypothetical protein